MTKARDLSNLISTGVPNSLITLDANEIPNLAASKITSGTFADARIAASNVSQHATSFDDNKIVNDISTLAIRQASNENKGAYNTNSMFVDVFQDDTGIASHTTSSRNVNEYVSSITTTFGTPTLETGDFSSTYTATITFGLADGSMANWFNNSYSTGNASTGWYVDAGTNGTSVSGDHIKVDLGSGNAKIFTGFRIYEDNAADFGNWKIQGSNDDSSYTDLSSEFDWFPNTNPATNQYYFDVNWSNDIAYRYYKFVGISGNFNNSPWHTECIFKKKTSTLSTNATGNFIGNTITAPSSTSSMGAIITYQDQAGTNALNTDIVLQLSADNGSNFTTATLTALPDFATGIKMAKVNDLSVTAGTQLKYKISFANQASGSKEARIRGVSLQY